jgi:PRTRC genetic system protein B
LEVYVASERWLLLQHLLHVEGGQFVPESPGQFAPELVVSLPRNQVVWFIRISSGEAFVPGMIWKAGKDGVLVFACKGKDRPKEQMPLFHAPFFNINYNGAVCMGNVCIEMEGTTNLEEFMFKWEQYFFNSYFSHTLQGGSIIDGNIVQLWQGLLESGDKFPEGVLKLSGYKLADLFR